MRVLEGVGDRRDYHRPPQAPELPESTSCSRPPRVPGPSLQHLSLFLPALVTLFTAVPTIRERRHRRPRPGLLWMGACRGEPFDFLQRNGGACGRSGGGQAGNGGADPAPIAA